MDKPAILMVDDQKGNLLALERILQRTGAVTVKAHSGNDALKACLNQEFALALLDVNMPEMNGFELAELMRGEQCLSRVPIIFLTADYTQQHQIFQGYSCGAVDYMVKPLQPEILLNKVNVFLDIYRQKKQLQRLNGELQQARDAAEEATRAKSAFLANMSHEIRTPMTVTLSALELLKDSGLREDQAQLLEMASSSSHSLLGLISDILDVSKIEARMLDLHPEPCIVGLCLEKAVNLFTLQAERKGLKLLLELAPGVPETAVFDPDRFHQVLVNLLGNAIKFTEQGCITLGAAGQGNGLLISLRDTGIGIPNHQLGRLFESFTQLDASSTRRYGGTGLGLAISKGLVELMGGEIWAESRPGAGSTFFFTVPQVELAVGPVAGSPRREKIDQLAALQARIMVVDDDPLLRQLVAMFLEKWECQVLAVEGAEEALRILGQNGGCGCDLILMDMQMPKLNGLDATRAIREKERDLGCYIPIVALTAHARPEDQRDCLQAGMDAWVTKPIDTRELHAVLRRELGRRRS